ncbi:uncharacterized protein LOC143217826 [Lasioglossum baleicum]|uniref:uncharacterized protein LOC143217826 n=1 Tax=Lasioglossum baleicum TaxID=434251 RepID=UPI003FCD88F0
MEAENEFEFEFDLLEDLPINDGDECLRRFIGEYETLPELWSKVHPNYLNKYKKQRALEKLLLIYKEMKPTAILKDVSKKINTLRSNYRRELNKIKTSMRSGSGTNEIYKPTSWVFYALKFLQDSESPAPLIMENDNTQASQEFIQSGTSYSSISTYPPPTKKKKGENSIAKQNELLQVACDYLAQSNTNNSSQEDEYLIIAKVWSNKLKSLEPMQKRLAEKAINDILFEAEMESLNRDSVQINSSVSKSSAAEYFANYKE